MVTFQVKAHLLVSTPEVLGKIAAKSCSQEKNAMADALNLSIILSTHSRTSCWNNRSRGGGDANGSGQDPITGTTSLHG